MLVTIAAAAAATALAPASAEQPAPSPALKAKPAMVILHEAGPAGVCKGAGRMQVSYQSALLYRPGPEDRVKRLIDMPEAEACLLGGAK